jgi:hypothetical protein
VNCPNPLLPSHRIMKRIKNVTITVLTIIESIRLYSALNAFSKILRKRYELYHFEPLP